MTWETVEEALETSHITMMEVRGANAADNFQLHLRHSVLYLKVQPKWTGATAQVFGLPRQMPAPSFLRLFENCGFFMADLPEPFLPLQTYRGVLGNTDFGEICVGHLALP